MSQEHAREMPDHEIPERIASEEEIERITTEIPEMYLLAQVQVLHGLIFGVGVDAAIGIDTKNRKLVIRGHGPEDRVYGGPFEAMSALLDDMLDYMELQKEAGLDL